MVNIHILVIYNCKNLLNCFIFYEILRLQFIVKIRLDATFSGIPSTKSFGGYDYIGKMYTKIICNICSGRFDVRLQEIQPFLKFPYLISLIKSPNTSFEIRKALRRMPSLAHTEMDQT